jgi:signal transduction histidine kinase
MRKPGSLIGALFGRIGLLFVVLVLVAAAVTSSTARDKIDEAYDGQLIIAANVLQALMADEIRERARNDARANLAQTELSIDNSPLLSQEDRQAFDQFADWRMFRIWIAGRLAMHSDTGPSPVAEGPVQSGFKDVIAEGLKWRIYTLPLKDHPAVVQVGERLDIRRALVRNISLELLAPLLLLVPATALLLWLSLRGGLQALRALVSALSRRSARDLAPLPLDSSPSDLRPLVSSVNQLLERINSSLQHERRFVDRAAHQLRTPLSVVKLQAQMIAREERPAERAALIAQLASGVDRASQLIDRLLTLARLETEVHAGGNADLAEEAVGTIADLAPLAAQRKVALAFKGEGSAPVAADVALVKMICANLIDNAIRYSPPDTEIAVEIEPSPGQYKLRVVDAGPGIPASERGHVLERFNRGKAPREPGTGLGLSIVSEALRLIGGSLELNDRPDGELGLAACVILPARELSKA